METTVKSEDIIAAIEKMSVLDLANLVKALEEKFGVSAAVPVFAGPAPGTAAAGAEIAKEEVADEHTIILADAGEKRIQVLKVLRELTGLGLKEAKELVDSAPKPIKEKIPMAEAENIKKKLEEQGAKIDIK